MKVLITGAFGNLGLSTLENLLKTPHEITTLDLPSFITKKIAKKLKRKRKLITRWGSVTDLHVVEEVVKNQNCIIHFAGVTPPFTEKNPDLAYKINVEGTKYIIKTALAQTIPPKIIYPSSISIYGSQPPSYENRTSQHPINPSDVYTNNKAEAERIIIESGLPWIIFRITAAPSISILKNDLNLLYNIPMEQKIEFVHTKDIGLAIANVVSLGISKKILLLGGGKNSQYVNREFVKKLLNVLGIGMLPEEVFKKPIKDNDWYYTNWMNSEESEELLKYQKHSFDDYLAEIKNKTKFLRLFLKMFKPIVRKVLINQSPFYKENLK